MRKKVVVIGAGVVGTTLAYWLSQNGCQVLVLDKNSAPAMGTSHGNAGIVALGHAEAWGGPDIPGRLVSAVAGTNPALKISKPLDPALWRWGPRFLGECTRENYQQNSNKLMRLCEYSVACLRHIGDKEKIEHHRLDHGALYLFRDASLLARRVENIARDPDASRLLEVKTVEQIIELDPALKGVAADLVGGVYSRSDLSGDCFMFTQGLASRLSNTGRAEFRFGETVTDILRSGYSVGGVSTDQGEYTADHVVVSAGNASTALYDALGVYLPIYPVKGYSMTFPVLDSTKVPQYPAIDEDCLVSYARYGDRLRMTSIAEFAGDDDSLNTKRLQWVADYARNLCGDGLNYEDATRWAGLRPATPSSNPYIGRSKNFDNLWVNAGHGQLGWSMSAGSSRLLADKIAGLPVQIRGVSAEADWLYAL